MNWEQYIHDQHLSCSLFTIRLCNCMDVCVRAFLKKMAKKFLRLPGLQNEKPVTHAARDPPAPFSIANRLCNQPFKHCIFHS